MRRGSCATSSRPGAAAVSTVRGAIPAVIAPAVSLGLAAGALNAVLAVSLARHGTTAPSLGLVIRQTLWETSSIVFSGLLALGLASVVLNPAFAVGGVIGGHLFASFFLVDVTALGDLRRALPLGALGHLRPGVAPLFPSMSAITAVLVLVLWATAGLLAGAWRTETLDV